MGGGSDQSHPQKASEPRRVVPQRRNHLEANWLKVRCLKALRRANDAIAHLQDITEFASEDPTVCREMGMIYLNDKHGAHMAVAMFTKSLALDPNQSDLTVLIAQLQQDAPRGPQRPASDLPIPGIGRSAPGVPKLLPIPKAQLPTAPGQ
jgi:hypothetical protein